MPLLTDCIPSPGFIAPLSQRLNFLAEFLIIALRGCRFLIALQLMVFSQIPKLLPVGSRTVESRQHPGRARNSFFGFILCGMVCSFFLF